MNKCQNYTYMEIKQKIMEINPFIYSNTIDVFVHNEDDTLVDMSSIPTGGEIVSNPNVVKLSKKFVVDRANKVNIYMTPELRMIYMRISEISHKLLRYIEGNLRYNEDIVYINIQKFMEESLIKSRTTYSKGIEELCRYGFITPYHKRNKYWINPLRFFNGNRIKKYPNNLNKE